MTLLIMDKLKKKMISMGVKLKKSFSVGNEIILYKVEVEVEVRIAFELQCYQSLRA